MKIKSVLAITIALATLVGVASAEMLSGNPGPSNNGGSAGWAIFFDLESLGGALTVTELTTANTAVAFDPFSVEIFTRTGSGLGGPVGSGPGSSTAGWTSLGVAAATQGATSSGISDPIDIPDIAVPAGGTVGVAVQFAGAGPRYTNGTTPPYGTYSDANLMLTTGDSRSAPFTTGGSFFSPRELTGTLTYVIPEPSTVAMIGVVLAGLILGRRR